MNTKKEKVTNDNKRHVTSNGSIQPHIKQYEQNMDKMANVVTSCLMKADIVQFGFIACDSGLQF